jgi:hypothetical protein
MLIRRWLRFLVIFVIGFVVVGSADETLAEHYTVALGTNDIRTITPQDESLGKFYLVSIDVPTVLEDKDLLGAFLEILVDVDSRPADGVSNEFPMLEVYALTEDFVSELNPSKLTMPSPMRRNVVVGEDRTVKIDIREVVRKYMASPEDNHGLILGSLTNARDGLFELKSSNGRLATLTYYYLAK